MASAEDHAKSSAELFGGKWHDYFTIHNFFDVTRDIVAPYWRGNTIPDFRHRALRHHDIGIDIIETLLDHEIMNSDGDSVSVRAVGEQHMYEDFDRIPTFDDWWHGRVTPMQLNDDGAAMVELIITINAEPWMCSHARVLNHKEYAR